MFRKSNYITLLLFILTLYDLRINVLSINNEHNAAQEKAVGEIIARLIGERSKYFTIKIESAEKESVRIRKMNSSSQVEIVGTNSVIAAYGFHYYLKNYCNCHISWDSDQLNVPDVLPDINVSLSSLEKFRYYQNVCTTSYSFVWWNETRWLREIDWMALNGINLALAFSGQEIIWRRVYKHFNLTEEDFNDHFTGPAFLSWGRMGNVRKWAGPLSDNWHLRSLRLQHFILRQMRSLNIIPVLPCFSGHVPQAFKRLYPNASMTKLPKWNSFPDEYCCPYILNPTDPLFRQIGTVYMRHLIDEFGTDHFYQCDMFNEMNPSRSDDQYLKNISQIVFQTMAGQDIDAVWILQGWMFVHQPIFWTNRKVAALLSGVSDDRLIILDLQSELYPQYQRLNLYYGKSFIWCMLHNFGGTLGLHGSSDILNSRIFEARNLSGNRMVGIGLTPEGINQNYVIYDLLIDLTWSKEPLDLSNWFVRYAVRRYGVDNAALKNAWLLLKDTVYNYKMLVSLHGQYPLCSRPNLRLLPWTWYNVEYLLQAWDNLLHLPVVVDTENFNHDLVDVTRQVLQITFDKIYLNVVRSFKNNNYTEFNVNRELLLSVLVDLEAILSTHKHFLLGVWLNDAANAAVGDLERELYQWNARNQITLWGPTGEILDYATKQWSGVAIDYYFLRWNLFLEHLDASLTLKTNFSQEQFDEDVFNSVEKPFTVSRKYYPILPKGNCLSVALDIHNRWRNFI